MRFYQQNWIAKGCLLAGVLCIAGCPSTGTNSSDGGANTVTAVPPAASPSESPTDDTAAKKDTPSAADASNTAASTATNPPGVDATAPQVQNLPPPTGATLSTADGNKPPASATAPVNEALTKHNQFLDHLKKIEVIAPTASQPSSWNRFFNSFRLAVAYADNPLGSFPGILTADNGVDRKSQGALFDPRVMLQLSYASNLSAILLTPNAFRYVEETIYRDGAPYDDANLYPGSTNYGAGRIAAGHYYVRVYYAPTGTRPESIWDGIRAGHLSGQQFYYYYDNAEDPLHLSGDASDTRIHPDLESTINLTYMSAFPVVADGRRCRQDTEPVLIRAGIADARPLCSALEGGREPDGFYTFALFNSSNQLINASVVAKYHGAVAAAAGDGCRFGTPPHIFLEMDGDHLLVKMHTNGYPNPITKARVILHGALSITGADSPHTTIETVVDPGVARDGMMIGGDSYTRVLVEGLDTPASCRDQVITLTRLQTTVPVYASMVDKQLQRAEIFARIDPPPPPPGYTAEMMGDQYRTRIVPVPYTYDGRGVGPPMH